MTLPSIGLLVHRYGWWKYKKPRLITCDWQPYRTYRWLIWYIHFDNNPNQKDVEFTDDILLDFINGSL